MLKILSTIASWVEIAQKSHQLSWGKILPTSSSDDAAVDASENKNCIHDCADKLGIELIDCEIEEWLKVMRVCSP